MKPLVSVAVGEDQVVLVEVDDVGDGIVRAARPGEVVASLGEVFHGALARIRPMAETIRTQFDALAERPEEIGVEFGLKVHAEAGVVIAHTGGEANFKVTLRWERQHASPERA